jgi:hypothetical protein
MQIKEVLAETTAMICGRIDKTENNIEKLAGILEYNKPVLAACDSVVLVLNRDPAVSEDEVTTIFDLYKQTFENCYLLQPHPVGLGHQVGHVALDKTGYLFIKNNLQTKYTMKLCVDIMLSDKLLKLEVGEADLYYLPSVSLGDATNKWSVVKNDSLVVQGYSGWNYNYQTWFFIATNDTPFLYEPDEVIERVFRAWDFTGDVNQSKVLCAEHSLVRWSINNNLKRFSLFSPHEFDNYGRYVMRNRIVDGSLKNVIIEPQGITHAHFMGQPFTEMFL